jgi:hypothetical protein
MARGMHRHRSIRRQRLAAHKIETRARKAPAKVKARGRRDVRIIAKIKATPAGIPYAPEVLSWLAVHLDKPATKITPAEIAAVIA